MEATRQKRQDRQAGRKGSEGGEGRGEDGVSGGIGKRQKIEPVAQAHSIRLAGSALSWAEMEWPGRGRPGLCWLSTREGSRSRASVTGFTSGGDSLTVA